MKAKIQFDLDCISAFDLWHRLLERLREEGIPFRTTVGGMGTGKIQGSIVFDKDYEDVAEALLIELGLKGAPN